MTLLEKVENVINLNSKFKNWLVNKIWNKRLKNFQSCSYKEDSEKAQNALFNFLDSKKLSKIKLRHITKIDKYITQYDKCAMSFPIGHFLFFQNKLSFKEFHFRLLLTSKLLFDATSMIL